MVRRARIQSIRIVNLLIVDVDLNTRKKLNAVYKSKRKNWSLVVLHFLIRFCLFFVLFFKFFGIESFLTTNKNQFQFRSLEHLSWLSVVVPIWLKLKSQTIFINWGRRIYILFVGWQEIVNYRAFPYKIFRNFHRRLVPMISWHF